MNVGLLISILLLSSLAFPNDTPKPQQAPGNSAVTFQASASPASSGATRRSKPAGITRGVAPTTPVVTIAGLCQGSAKRNGCKTSITRAQFESLMSVLPSERGNVRQPVSAVAKRQFAAQYSRQLVLAAEAEKRNLQNTPEGRELLEYARSQALAQLLSYQLKVITQPTPDDVKAYYAANQDHYTELTLERVYIPIQQLADGKSNEAGMRALADDLHQRAATVTEFDGLQAEANEKAAIKNPPQPRVVLPASALPPSQEEVLHLRVGELSKVIQDASGFSFYKLIEKKPLALEAEANEIQESLGELKLRMVMDKLVSSNKPVLNPQYFQQNAPVARRGSRKTITLPPQQPYRVPTASNATSPK